MREHQNESLSQDIYSTEETCDSDETIDSDETFDPATVESFTNLIINTTPSISEPPPDTSNSKLNVSF